VADHQTAGRGRLGRRWEDAAAGPKGSEAEASGNPIQASIFIMNPIYDGMLALCGGLASPRGGSSVRSALCGSSRQQDGLDEQYMF